MKLAGLKTAARKAAFSRRKAAHSDENGGPCRPSPGAARLLEFLHPYRGKIIAAYMPIQTEIDPLPVMAEMAQHGPVCVPVIQGDGQALLFREWRPGCAMCEGPFGAQVPADGAWLVPEIVIVPLVAFDRQGGRLGYGGGFYDRTLEGLRARRPTLAIGFAYGAQETDALPLEPTDQPLDAVITEHGVLQPLRLPNEGTRHST